MLISQQKFANRDCEQWYNFNFNHHEVKPLSDLSNHLFIHQLSNKVECDSFFKKLVSLGAIGNPLMMETLFHVHMINPHSNLLDRVKFVKERK